ncbi:conserved hypothetical protein [Halogranum amylolyticum]|uniref:EthD domain-containing protein n=1 Tax=Halogranum amylolyticum TaxID=660520 RepID=A0A1H8WIV2_9EURY|nr:EthD family reductase [Halogranum amylolyticum]SEP27576.1 conserved hypothetical protein [Halogranum amylolyticum]
MRIDGTLVRKDGQSHEEFLRYWENEHAPIAKELPGLVKYTIDYPTAPEKSAYDGIAQLYFEDMQALKEAFTSEAGEKVQEDATNFIDVEQGPTLYLEESVQVDYV